MFNLFHYFINVNEGKKIDNEFFDICQSFINGKIHIRTFQLLGSSLIEKCSERFILDENSFKCITLDLNIPFLLKKPESNSLKSESF